MKRVNPEKVCQNPAQSVGDLGGASRAQRRFTDLRVGSLRVARPEVARHP